MDCYCVSGVVCAVSESDEEEADCLKWKEGISQWIKASEFRLVHGKSSL